MIERPIIFNGDQVKSVLNGRKTQTRRIMNPQPDACPDERCGHWWPSNAVRSMVHIENEFIRMARKTSYFRQRMPAFSLIEK